MSYILPVLVAGSAYVLLSNGFYRRPDPTQKHAPGDALPNPRFLYSDPAIWTSAPVDISYLPYEEFYGTNNDPRRRYLLFGGTRVVHSGYDPVVKTNMVWDHTNKLPTGGKPGYTYEPELGRGVPSNISDNVWLNK